MALNSPLVKDFAVRSSQTLFPTLRGFSLGGFREELFRTVFFLSARMYGSKASLFTELGDSVKLKGLILQWLMFSTTSGSNFEKLFTRNNSAALTNRSLISPMMRSACKKK